MIETASEPKPSFKPDGFGDRAKLGLVYIASSVVMEPELYSMSPAGVSWHASRLHLPKVTVAGIDEMMRAPQLETAIRLLAEAPLDVIAFGGTSASFLHGTAWDRGLVASMAEWAPGITPTTASTAVLAALESVGAGPVAMATPYTEDIDRLGIRFLGENGHEVVSSRGLGISGDLELALVSPETVFDLAVSVDVAEATALFISCTNLRTIATIAALEDRLGKPVISAVQATGWHAMRLAGIDDQIDGYGSLLGLPLPRRSEHGST